MTKRRIGLYDKPMRDLEDRVAELEALNEFVRDYYEKQIGMRKRRAARMRGKIAELEARNEALAQKIEKIREITKTGGYLERGAFEYERVIPAWELEAALGDE